MTTHLFGNIGTDGATQFVIEATETTARIGEREVRLRGYGGEVPGPVLHAAEGERVRIVFRNRLAEPTNLHLHGMPMPPEVDDPHRIVQPGESTTYEFTIPEGAAGTYWYHPHMHGEVARQLGEGLVGAMVVRGPDDDLPPLLEAAEHVLVFQDISLDGDRPRLRTVMEMHDGREGDVVLTNGRVAPALSAAAGLVRLRLVNGSSARFHKIVLEGAPMFLLGLDAGLLEAPVSVGSLLLPPGQRADVLVPASEAGTLVLRSVPYNRGQTRLPGQKPKPIPNEGVLATIEVSGHRAGVELPRRLRPVERLDPRDAAVSRTFEFGGKGNMLRFVFEALRGKKYGPGEGSRGPVRFWINGREFEPTRVDVEAVLGTTELWELRNPTPMDHPFHLHIHPFQVVDVDGVAPAFAAFQDVVNVPAGKTVRILVPFRRFAGTTMFHCHILEHEDSGMMAHLRVVDPKNPAAAAHACPTPPRSWCKEAAP